MPADPLFDPMTAFAAAGRLVNAFETGRRSRAAAEAGEIRLLADAAASVSAPAQASIEDRRRSELARRALVSDLATSSRVSEWTVTRLLSESADLCARFGLAVEALERGDISRQHVAVIHDLGHPIDDDLARDQFVQVAVERAQTLTPGRLSAVLKVIAERFLEQPLEERHTAAVARRDVRVVDRPDGLATLELTNAATLIHGIRDRLTAQARSAIAARTSEGGSGAEREGDVADAISDERTMDQVRADVATDLLLTAGPEDCVAGKGLDAIRATVQVTLPVLTMTGASTEPALLAGYGPIDRPHGNSRRAPPGGNES